MRIEDMKNNRSFFRYVNFIHFDVGKQDILTGCLRWITIKSLMYFYLYLPSFKNRLKFDIRKIKKQVNLVSFVFS